MPPTPQQLRAARRARERADAAEALAQRLEREAGINPTGLLVSFGKIADGGAPVHKIILALGLTVAQAAEICGTTPDVLKKAWAKGSQFRRARPEWRRVLAAYGVPRKLWRDEP